MKANSRRPKWLKILPSGCCFLTLLVAPNQVHSMDPQFLYASSIATLDTVINLCSATIVLNGKKLLLVQEKWQLSLTGEDRGRFQEIYLMSKSDNEQRFNGKDGRSLESICVVSAIMVKVGLGKDNPITGLKDSNGVEKKL